MNSHIVSLLQKAVQSKQQQLQSLPRATTADIKKMKTGLRFSLSGLENAAQQISSLDFKVTDVRELDGIPGVGKGTIRRVQEILETGSLSELQGVCLDTPDSVIHRLQGIFGVGDNVMGAIRKAHITTTEQLDDAIKTGVLKLPIAVALAILHREDLLTRIPRNEITQLKKSFAAVLSKINPDLTWEITGSYRRQASDSGDVDVLMSCDDPKVFKKFVDRLTETGLLVGSLASGDTKFMGLVRHPKFQKVRRLDIRCVHSSSYAAALLYFTGSKQLNIAMRKRAISMGLKLNEYGLFRKSDSRQITANDEEDIFKALDMSYLEPKDRN